MPFNQENFIKQNLRSKITNFDDLALDLYRHQYQSNVVLQKYVNCVGGKGNPNALNELIFLPVSFFKTHLVKTGSFTEEVVFTSSTTSGVEPSKHYVAKEELYHQTYLEAFKINYGNPEQYVFLCLLPNYLERHGSSLVVMANGLINISLYKESDFYLYNFKELNVALQNAMIANKKVILLGVTFALLDFAERFPQPLTNVIVMETGGMKGRRQEQTRMEVHNYLKQQFQLKAIHSEYGMTELLSQAYSKGDGLFKCPDWMKVIITDLNDPFEILPPGSAGMINLIDLANVYSCAFIQTQDIGRVYADGTFEVLGRADFSEVRGCNLLYV
jgi:hypothetical protein